MQRHFSRFRCNSDFAENKFLTWVIIEENLVTRFKNELNHFPKNKK